MTHKSRAKHAGQVVCIHLSVYTLGDSVRREGEKFHTVLTTMKVALQFQCMWYQLAYSLLSADITRDSICSLAGGSC